jgi:CCR4-NOT transcription complex subunit 6
MRVKNISPSLFAFTYLTTLFLNHNNLTVIPSQIECLKALVLLDLSGNQLMSLPPEIGMLTAMKEFYLFDNHLTTLPGELGTLHQLDMIGLEGNPLEASLRALIQAEGTRALIAHLRDTCPVPAPPPERLWTYLESDAERKLQEADPNNESFSVLCYNVLCEAAGTSRMYPYTPSWALTWDYRKELILTEIMNYDADFLCLQEVDIAQYEEYFMQHLSNQGYEGVYWPRGRAKTMTEPARRMVDGSATFFKTSK